MIVQGLVGLHSIIWLDTYRMIHSNDKSHVLYFHAWSGQGSGMVGHDRIQQHLELPKMAKTRLQMRQCFEALARNGLRSGSGC
jgi:hypothetical protein